MRRDRETGLGVIRMHHDVIFPPVYNVPSLVPRPAPQLSSFAVRIYTLFVLQATISMAEAWERGYNIPPWGCSLKSPGAHIYREEMMEFSPQFRIVSFIYFSGNVLFILLTISLLKYFILRCRKLYIYYIAVYDGIH